MWKVAAVRMRGEGGSAGCVLSPFAMGAANSDPFSPPAAASAAQVERSTLERPRCRVAVSSLTPIGHSPHTTDRLPLAMSPIGSTFFESTAARNSRIALARRSHSTPAASPTSRGPPRRGAALKWGGGVLALVALGVSTP